MVVASVSKLAQERVLKARARKSIWVRILLGALKITGPCGGIGRRADFKCPCPKGCAGSNPARAIERV